jgi:hypothetical protein
LDANVGPDVNVHRVCPQAYAMDVRSPRWGTTAGGGGPRLAPFLVALAARRRERRADDALVVLER